MRSASPAVRNPLLRLASAQRIKTLTPEARAALSDVLADLASDAALLAQSSWKKHKAPMAAYWKAVSVYANHARRLCRPEAR